MLRVGLTGGIASGKTTVAALLRKYGAPVLDADALGHELLSPGKAPHDEVLREFGDSVLGAGGTIDRAKLGSIVFSDAEKRGRLNAILHPPIMQEVQKWFAVLQSEGIAELAFVEAALLVEAGYHKSLDRLVVCWCQPEQQIERMMKRGLTQAQARLRLASQMPADEKRRAADRVIDCSGTLARTDQQVREMLEALRDEARMTPNVS